MLLRLSNREEAQKSFFSCCFRLLLPLTTHVRTHVSKDINDDAQYKVIGFQVEKDKSKKRRLNLSGSCQSGTLQLTIPLSCQVVYKGFVNFRYLHTLVINVHPLVGLVLLAKGYT